VTGNGPGDVLDLPLGDAVRCHHDIGGLDVPMDDAAHVTAVQMVQRRSSLGFMDESLFGVGIAGEVWREGFERYGAVELEVLGFVDNTHSCAAQLLKDLVDRRYPLALFR
jgi:hypothetical protein